MKQKHHIKKYLLYALLIFFLLVIGALLYSYLMGGTSNYQPPKLETGTDVQQAVNDLNSIAKAVDSYYSVNLTYPASLKDLSPDFITVIPVNPLNKEEYIYNALGDTVYEVKVSSPGVFNLKELKVRNGKIIKN